MPIIYFNDKQFKAIKDRHVSSKYSASTVFKTETMPDFICRTMQLQVAPSRPQIIVKDLAIGSTCDIDIKVKLKSGAKKIKEAYRRINQTVSVVAKHGGSTYGVLRIK